jgi:import receptor subunit TOM22
MMTHSPAQGEGAASRRIAGNPECLQGPSAGTDRAPDPRAGPSLWRPAGKAAWIAGTSFLVLVVPLIIEMDREQQMVEFESQQLGALTGTATPAKA